MPLIDTCRPLMVNFDGFSPAHLILAFTTVVPAEPAKLAQVPAFDPLATLFLMGLADTAVFGGTGVPPVQPLKVEVNVMTSFFTPGVPAALSGGLKAMVPPTPQTGEPVPVTFLATAAPSRKTTLASGSVNAAATIKPILMRMTSPLLFDPIAQATNWGAPRPEHYVPIWLSDVGGGARRIAGCVGPKEAGAGRPCREWPCERWWRSLRRRIRTNESSLRGPARTPASRAAPATMPGREGR